MKINKLIRTICFLFMTTVFCVSCNQGGFGHARRPKYLLDGSKVGEDAEGDYEYYSIDGANTYAVGLKKSSKDKTSLAPFPTEYNSKQVTGIWRSGFHNSQCTSITIPSSITVIDYEAFMESKITTITIPATVTEIGEAAFYSCKSLTKATIQNTTSSSQASSACSCIESQGGDPQSSTASTLETIPAFCFFNCHALKEVVFPESIKSIGGQAFYNCRELYSTLAFMNIEEIGYRAFQGCLALTKVYISSSFFEKDENDKPIGIVGEKAFDACNSNLVFYLVGDDDNIDDWLDLSTNADWNQKNALVNPGAQINPGASSALRYTYYKTAAGASYTNDWIYTVDLNNDVDITSYIGPTEIGGNPIKYITFPDDLPDGTGHYVRSIAKSALDTVRSHLERIYLPKHLRRIEGSMFDSNYTNLIVIDDNTKCPIDEAYLGEDEGNTLTGRIVLNGLTDLEVIGKSAFVGMPHLPNILKLYLPYSLKGVGSNAFGSSSKHMQGVTDFQWDYDDENSALKVIGKEAFFELGRSDGNGAITGGNVHQAYLASNGNHNYELTTLIIPRTFEHFGITSNDITNFGLTGLEAETDDGGFGTSAFAGSPLLEKVVFKGSKQSTIQTNPSGSYVEEDTFNLVLGAKTFAMNQSLRTVVFEERVNKYIVFHTVNGTSSQPVIGWSSGKSSNDFGGDPALQTLVLPNKYTSLQIQNYAFACNSRGAIYFSAASNNDKIKGNTESKMTNSISNPTTNGNKALPSEWKTIGKDTSSAGYNFANQNRFGIDQQMPTYYSVLYEDQVVDDVIVGYGNSNVYIEQNRCAFVTNGNTDATMTNYLYDRHDPDFTGTAKVPYQVGPNNLRVTKIGDCAFSADYCDGDSKDNSKNYKNDTTHKDLTAVSVPDSVKTIGAYAFTRAYGVTSLSSYNVSTGVSNGEYVMPSSLTSIGKHAFAFCHIKKFLNIPDNCVFYENSNVNNIEATNITSVFSNNFSLRQITFGTSGATSNAKYTTTTYEHSGSEDNGQYYTSALYSTDSVTKNKKRLLLVLNRDVGDDRVSASDDLRIVPVQDGDDYGEFNGQYGYSGVTPSVTNYLYGAFKMGYWIKSLIVGTSNNNLDQPLISGIVDSANNIGKTIYLGQSYDFLSNDYITALETVSFGTSSTISTPPYSFAGCENLASITLPRVPGATIPAGLFASIGNANVVFRVPSDNTGNNFVNCQPGVLDLTYTGYAGIEKEAFKGSGITQVIAPEPHDSNPNDFFIAEDAFANCNSLTSVDFHHVTGTVRMEASFRGANLTSTTFNYGSSALIEFGKETFKGCTITSFTFPAKTAEIGTSCFESCSSLNTVTADAVLTYLKKITVDGGTHQDNNIIYETYNNKNKNNEITEGDLIEDRGGYKQIGDYAFYLCNSLTNFDFTKFAGIERIGHYAFSMNNNGSANSIVPANASTLKDNNATICPNGIVDLPSSLTNLGVGAFNASKVVDVTINSSEMRFERGGIYTKSSRAQANKGCHQFENCKSLLVVRFSNKNCAWTTPYEPKANNIGQDNIFSACDNLQKVFLPRGFEISHWEDKDNPGNNNRPDSMVWNSNSGMKFYLYHSLADWDGKAVCRYWHNTSVTYDNLIFYVNNSTEMIEYADNKYSLNIPSSSQLFWAMIGGNVVDLGRATGVNETTGEVTFSTTGYTAKSDGVYYNGVKVSS